MASIALWADDNKTLHSSPFEVKEGTVVALFAVGLEQFKVRQDSQTMQDKQRICVSRIVRDYTLGTAQKQGPVMNYCECNFVLNTSWLTEIELAEEIVTSGGCVWQLTQCSNFRIVGIPGLYRLHLNDDTVIGKAQVYAEQYDIQNIPMQMADLFFK